MYKAQIPLGEMRLDAGAPTLTVTVWKPEFWRSVAVNAPTIVQSEQGFSISFPYFMKLLYEGNLIAHSALWSPHSGVYFPREDFLCQNLVDTLLKAQGSLYHRWLCYLHAHSVVHERMMELERKDWASLDSIKYTGVGALAAEKMEAEMKEAPSRWPRLGNDPEPFNKFIKGEYEHLSLSVR